MGRIVSIIVVVLLVLGGATAAFVTTGVYDVGADTAHTRFVSGMLNELRDRSIDYHARAIAVPHDLNDPKRIAVGAGLYNEMCTGCHLGPGMQKTELSLGLYPTAPELARGDDLTPAQQFWVIKHGVKLTAMPAWGKTHSDDLIWDMVAFVRAMPRLSPEQYKKLAASGPESHEEMTEQGR